MRQPLSNRPIRGRFLFNLAITLLVIASFSADAQDAVELPRAKAPVNTVVATVPINGVASLMGLAVSPDSKFVYVASYYTNTIAVLDAATNKVGVTQLVAGNGPAQMAFSPMGTQLYIVNIVVDIFNNRFYPT
jgi:YVTN family beta-propeller protein